VIRARDPGRTRTLTGANDLKQEMVNGSVSGDPLHRA
jgi:hypothetical protein